ncbi:Protein kinase family protein [Rhynchospora pubera]|uniref:non-specific serine/threonine protein kinase n=1 Tax=Rhynchospora pubera TaxID=906938 RepID=A0AAV8CCV7_9POAL|nr:Protein kinase family protein [Rhynchospora pubera]
MVISLISIVALLLFSPCFSNPCPSAYPCNTSFIIQSPFCAYNDSCLECDDQTNNGCMGKGRGCGAPIYIRCNGNDPFINLFRPDLWFQLENISYNDSTLVIRDDNLSNSLLHSNCSSVTISFEPSPIDKNAYEFEEKYDLFSSIQCDLKTRHILNDFCERHHWTCLYSVNKEKFSGTCSNPPTFSFIWKLSFKNIQAGDLTLLSASFSNDPSCKGFAGTQSKSNLILIGSLTAAALATIIISALLIFKYERLSIFQTKYREQKEIEMLIEKYGSVAPKRYNYRELKKITMSFQDRLGKGAFGTVYKGSLHDGRFVVVKLLHEGTRDQEEFLNEVISIGRTSHVNVVRLLGFCTEGSKDALIYEYMPNGSLENYIYTKIFRDVLGWEKLYDIAISIARGIEYLHQGCNPRIVHFDIKPKNILLDEDFCPKIADFGLAKLCKPKESIVSLAEMRGTIGFIAPEVFSRSFGVPSTKSDVYSYGMMVLDMVGFRKNAKSIVENSSRDYFAHWIYDHVVQGREIETCNVTAETEGIARKMAIVGLWCIQTFPANRPSINGVVEMLEKSLDELELPPKPYLSSPQHSIILSLNSSSG